MMKKIVIAVLVTIMVAAAITAGYAIGPNAYWGNCSPGSCAGYNNLTPEQKAKVEALQQEIQPLREQMFAKRSELRALMTQQNPDWNAIEQTRKEMAELRTQIQKKAFESGVAGACGQYEGPRRMGRMSMMRGMM